MTDRLKPMTKAWSDRQRRHRHNGFLGSARMMQMQAQSIMDADSTTKKAKDVAAHIYNFASELAEELKTRIDK